MVGEAGDPRPRAGGALVRVADEAGSLAVRDSGVGVVGVEGVGGLLEVQPLNLVGDGSERALGVARGRCARIVAARVSEGLWAAVRREWRVVGGGDRQ